MDYLEQHPWRQYILAPISTDLSEEVDDENPAWQILDGEMVKLGSLEHELLNLNEMQQIALSLLSKESKDLRILAHLLRTLQHSENVLDLLLALQLFADYIQQFWQNSAPIASLKKQRLGLQIIKRFEKGTNTFRQSASRLEKEAAQALLEKIISLFAQDNTQEKLAQEMKNLSQRFLNVERADSEFVSQRIANTPSPQQGKSNVSHVAIPLETNVEIKPIELDTSNDRAWKNTLLKVVDYLAEKDQIAPISYQLRRYTIWHSITSLPMAENYKTPLAPPSVDLVSNYEQSLDSPNLAIWKEIEHSLTLSPYWFYGHYLSAKIAEKLGYIAVAKVIKQSVNEFIERLPDLCSLRFNDDTPFFPEKVLAWLHQNELQTVIAQDVPLSVEQYKQESLEQLLQHFEQQTYTNLRDKFYGQLALAQQLEERSLKQLANQHYLALYKAIEQFSIFEWESSLKMLLEQKLASHNALI